MRIVFSISVRILPPLLLMLLFILLFVLLQVLSFFPWVELVLESVLGFVSIAMHSFT